MKLVLVCLAMALTLSACGGTSSAARGPAGPTPTRAAAALLAPTPAIEPVTFPADESPHDSLTEWWYYTGHLLTATGDRYGFEFVVFQAKRLGFPTGYAAHFAITDGPNKSFAFDQRISLLAQAPAPHGFDLKLGDWEMSGFDGTDTLSASMQQYGIDLVATATKSPVLHNRIGYFSYGDLGGSYYYSRTRVSVTGRLTVGGTPIDVTGEAWMDHQWGNFIPVASGGWDWFSVQLADGVDLMLYLIRDDAGNVLTTYGTLVNAEGTATEIASDEFTVQPTGSWTSPTSAATYPSGWTIDIASRGITLTLTPTVLDQELDTRRSTGVVYWEGEVTVDGVVDGVAATGLGYVELTGYAKR